MTKTFSIRRLHGSEILPYLPELAKLRIEIFREYPYLYDGNLVYEEKYLKTYADCKDSVMIIALSDHKVIGASTAIPMTNEVQTFKQPFIDHGIDVSKIFYFGESVLLPSYRGLGIGKRFFEERIASAKQSGHYSLATFCAVEREKDHPAKPHDYRPLYDLWKKFGFVKHPELHTTIDWKEIGETEETPKPMIFWLKEL